MDAILHDFSFNNIEKYLTNLCQRRHSMLA